MSKPRLYQPSGLRPVGRHPGVLLLPVSQAGKRAQQHSPWPTAAHLPSSRHMGQLPCHSPIMRHTTCASLRPQYWALAAGRQGRGQGTDASICSEGPGTPAFRLSPTECSRVLVGTVGRGRPRLASAHTCDCPPHAVIKHFQPSRGARRFAVSIHKAEHICRIRCVGACQAAGGLAPLPDMHPAGGHGYSLRRPN